MESYDRQRFGLRRHAECGLVDPSGEPQAHIRVSRKLQHTFWEITSTKQPQRRFLDAVVARDTSIDCHPP